MDYSTLPRNSRPSGHSLQRYHSSLYFHPCLSSKTLAYLQEIRFHWFPALPNCCHSFLSYCLLLMYLHFSLDTMSHLKNCLPKNCMPTVQDTAFPPDRVRLIFSFFSSYLILSFYPYFEIIIYRISQFGGSKKRDVTEVTPPFYSSLL